MSEPGNFSLTVRFPKWDGTKEGFVEYKKAFLGTIASHSRYKEYEAQINTAVAILGTGVASTKTKDEEKKL